ncbi:type 1 glutamine amidotransferase [Patulibacter sp.]|uniref:type 1 glutamine amidotransferase n=1 Tax=Patulibacter sp. TaxID=1912859 RepID=UPI002729394E|nr:type 1 glutamine amidotransferase [Patulibacter sp.]MDO9406899.1 type 1 glutamine amidotransferase [Patulibacter sp.]
MWAIVHHVPYDGSGGIGGAVRRSGTPAVHLRPYLGDDLPAVADLTGLVVLGGPSESAGDDVPYLRAERALLASAAHAGLPVLGVCFGAQLLAVALGGAVRRAPQPEVGIGEVELTAEGLDDPLLGPVGPRIPALHWHGDEIVRPPGSVGLATSAGCPEQAFRWGTRAWGLQFHAELDATMADLIRPQMRDVPLAPAAVEAAEVAGTRIADAFVGTAAGR